MDHWADGAETIWEVKCDGVGSQLCYDLVWSQKLISKLFRGMGSAEKLCLDIGLTPKWEFWSQKTKLMNISGTLIMELHHCHVLS